MFSNCVLSERLNDRRNGTQRGPKASLLAVWLANQAAARLLGGRPLRGCTRLFLEPKSSVQSTNAHAAEAQPITHGHPCPNCRAAQDRWGRGATLAPPQPLRVGSAFQSIYLVTVKGAGGKVTAQPRLWRLHWCGTIIGPGGGAAGPGPCMRPPPPQVLKDSCGVGRIRTGCSRPPGIIGANTCRNGL